MLPEPVRRRRKTPAMGEPVLALWRETATALPGSIHSRLELAQYVVSEAIEGPDEMWVNLRLRSLSLWFQYSLPAQTFKVNTSKEEYHAPRT